MNQGYVHLTFQTRNYLVFFKKNSYLKIVAVKKHYTYIGTDSSKNFCQICFRLFIAKVQFDLRAVYVGFVVIVLVVDKVTLEQVLLHILCCS
jgi:hypothetical protein